MTRAPTKTPPARHPAALLMQVRTLHTYVGMLIAPVVLFMATTGILQLYGLHEAHTGYTPAPLVEKLGMVHKDQRFAAGHHGPPPGQAAPKRAPKPAAAEVPESAGAKRSALATALLKATFAAVAIGLIGSTLMGLWMALRQPAKRRIYIALLLVGALIPTVLAALSA